MKCVITGKDTNSLTNNVPLSVEARGDLNELHKEYNDKLREKFIKSFISKVSDPTEERIEQAGKLAPKVTKKFVLNQIAETSVRDVMSQFDVIEVPEEIIEEVTGESEETEEVETNEQA